MRGGLGCALGYLRGIYAKTPRKAGEEGCGEGAVLFGDAKPR